MRLLAISLNYLRITFITCLKIVYKLLCLHLSATLIFYFWGDDTQAYHVYCPTLGPEMLHFTCCWNKPLSFSELTFPGWVRYLPLGGMASASGLAFKGQAALNSEGSQLGCHLMATFVSEKWLLEILQTHPWKWDLLSLWVIPDESMIDIYSSL